MSEFGPKLHNACTARTSAVRDKPDKCLAGVWPPLLTQAGSLASPGYRGKIATSLRRATPPRSSTMW
jgi:hypothetical protein